MSSSGFAPLSYPELGTARRAGASSAEARGYAAGYAQGLRRAADEYADAERERSREHRAAEAEAGSATLCAVAALDAAVAEVRALTVPVVEDADRALVEAALALAEAVLHREVTGGHVTAADALRRALASLPEDELVSVRLHPDDARDLQRHANAVPEIVADESVSRGDAVAVLRHGWLDARIAGALDRARTVLTEGLA